MNEDSQVAAEIPGPSVHESIRRSFVRFWASVKLAVVLILAIAIASTLGTLVPQGDPAGVTRIAGMSDTTKRFLLAIGAHNVYYSGWFLGLLALFFLNLAVCTYVRVWPRLAFALRRPRDIPVPARDFMPEQQRFPGVSVDTVGAALRQARYRTYPTVDGGLVADKNRLFRFAPMVVHIGLFLVVAGGITAGLLGFKHSFPLLPGEAMSARRTIADAATRGRLTPPPADFEVRLDKFWVARYDDGRVKQYYSTLSVLEAGAITLQKTIHVNEPLKYKGIYYYQSFWGLGAEKVTVDRGIRSEIRMLPGEGSLALAGWITRPFKVGGASVLAYSAGPDRPWYLLDESDLGSYGELAVGRSLAVGGHELSVAEVRRDTGLAAVWLRIGSRRLEVVFDSARRFGLGGYISRALDIGGRRAFLYAEGASSPLNIVDLETFQAIASIPLGSEVAVGGTAVAFEKRRTSGGGRGLASVKIARDGVSTKFPLVDLSRTGLRIAGAASEKIQIGGKTVFLLHATEQPRAPLWMIDAHDSTAIGIFNPGESRRVGFNRVRYDGPIHFSGLQTKSDPGIPIVYTGFLVLIAGTVLGMWSHKQVWVTPGADGCRLGAKANRGRHVFHLEMARLRERLVEPRVARTVLPDVKTQRPEPAAAT